MKRTTKIFGIITTLAVALIIGYLIFGLDLIPKSRLESSLRKAVKDNKGGTISINDLTTFKWDRMDIYTPYSTYKGANGKAIDVDEGECLLVFGYKGAVVSILNYKRFYGDFSSLYREGGYSPSSARFKVPVKDQSNWIKLEWAQNESPAKGPSGLHR
ncbi:MAG: hypothetical protein FIA94_01435 [Nitrospirae bacterium]|nr:hypothetical protein [Nitrospirota bacterium]